MDADGNYVWPGENIPLSTVTGNKIFFTAGEYSSGQWIAAWADFRQHPLQAVFSNIYAQNISINGTLGPLSTREPVKTSVPVLMCYPNPASDIVYIRVDGAQGVAKDDEVKICNIQGKVILTGDYTQASSGFDIKN